MSTTLEELRRLTLEQQRAETASAEPFSQPAHGAPVPVPDSRTVPNPRTRGGFGSHGVSGTPAEAPGSPSNTQSTDIGSQPVESKAPGMEGEVPAESSSFHDDAQMRICASKQARKHARKQLLAQASTHASTHTCENTRFLDRVREGIARKTAHPGGIKASVDISPELSLRVKRYCLDHGNVPVRLVFVELLTAFLEEEGY